MLGMLLVLQYVAVVVVLNVQANASLKNKERHAG